MEKRIVRSGWILFLSLALLFSIGTRIIFLVGEGKDTSILQILFFLFFFTSIISGWIFESAKDKKKIRDDSNSDLICNDRQASCLLWMIVASAIALLAWIIRTEANLITQSCLWIGFVICGFKCFSIIFRARPYESIEE